MRQKCIQRNWIVKEERFQLSPDDKNKKKFVFGSLSVDDEPSQQQRKIDQRSHTQTIDK